MHLEDQNQILQIVVAEDPANIDLIFHEATDKGNDGILDIEQTISVKRGKHRYSAVIKNFTGTPIKDKLMVALSDYENCEILVFTRVNGSLQWNQPEVYKIDGGFINAFLIPPRQNGACLLIFTKMNALALNATMEEVSRTNYETIDASLVECDNAKPDYNTALNNGSTWLMVFDEKCCMRMTINTDATIQPVDMKKESVD